MPAEIESFASLRQPGWHQLGTVFSKPVTADELMELAHLSKWNVRLIEIEAPGFNMNGQKYYFIVRDNPLTKEVDILSTAGQRYEAFQNETLFYMGHDLQEAGLGRWETAGSLKGGRVVFGSLSVDREVVLDPSGANDVIKNYLLLAASHDGTLAITAANTPVRVVCSNTLNFALSGAKQKFSFRHTQTAESKAQYVAKAMKDAHGYIDKFEAVANKLIGKKISDKVFNDILLAAYPKPAEKEEGKGNRAMTMWTKKFDVLNDLRTSPTNAMWDGTAWGALQVLTEDLDWFRTGRGDNAEENLSAARAGFDPAVNATRNKFLTIVSEVAGV